MSDAINRPTGRPRREVHTGDMPLAQKADIDLSLDAQIIHGEGLPNLTHEQELVADLAFMEEPVTIMIAENSGSKFPETHVAVQVNGKSAEVLHDGKWIAIGWFPMNQRLTTKRKYVEVLARARPESVQNIHEDATVERPRNHLQRTPRAAYPMSIIRDDNPRGHEWLSRIMMGH